MQSRRAGNRGLASPQEVEERLSPIQSALTWALLGLVIERSGHGYDLIKRFDAHYDGLLALNDPSYVYKALTALERRGLIEALPPEPAGSSARGIQKTPFRATEQGLAAYAQHLRVEFGDLERSASLLLRQTCGLLTSQQEDALKLIEEAEHACLKRRASSAKAPVRHAQGSPAGAVEAHLLAKLREIAIAEVVRFLALARAQFERQARAAREVPGDARR